MRLTIILASTSPRRRELMKKLGVKFKAVESEYREKIIPGLKPAELVKVLALGKAKAAAKKYPRAIVIGCDTLVEYREQILGKPKNKADARRMLKMLSGKTNYVFTGLAVVNREKNQVCLKMVKTKIAFKKYSDGVIQNYLSTGEPLDKAGAYAIQDWGRKLVKRITGDRDAAIGLPIRELKGILKRTAQILI